MASPPPFDICGDLDLEDDDPATAIAARRNPNPPPLAAPTPNGLNDRLLRLTRSRPRPPNPNPNPPPPAQARKVKLAGRRRLCKFSAADSICNILDDLTTRLDSLSVCNIALGSALQGNWRDPRGWHGSRQDLAVVGLKEKIRDYSGPSANVRNYELQYAFKECGILLTTYDIVRNNYKLIKGNFFNGAEDDEEEALWDYVILDEGHVIKNPKTQRAQSLFEIPCVHRIIISGTPIQNNLKEMWALFYFCCPEVLGDKEEFKMRYEMPILRGNDKNATNREKHVGSNVAKRQRKKHGDSSKDEASDDGGKKDQPEQHAAAVEAGENEPVA